MDFILSKHAQQRAVDMALDADSIHELLTHPHVKRMNKRWQAEDRHPLHDRKFDADRWHHRQESPCPQRADTT